MTQAPPVSAPDILTQLARILASSAFSTAERSRNLLKFVVEQTLAGDTERLKEYTLGTEALGRPESFDPRFDPIVRAEVSRLRTRLEHFYAAEGSADPVQISLPRGAYVPQFSSPAPSTIPIPTLHPSAAASSHRLALLWFCAGAITLAAIWSFSSLRNHSRPPAPVTKFEIQTVPDSVFTPPIARQPFAISPDGTHLAFTVAGREGTSVFLRDLAALDLREVANSNGAWGVFWSPDSQSIYFSVGTSLRKSVVESGSTQDVARLPYHAVAGLWRSNSDLLIFQGDLHPYELSIKTGVLTRISTETDVRWAQFLPGTDTFIHVVYDPQLGTYGLLATEFVSRKTTPILATDANAQYGPPIHPGDSGHLVFLRGGTLLAQAFDVPHLRLIGDPFTIAQNVIYFAPSASASFSVGASGTIAYQSGFPLSELRWYDRAGNVVATAAHPAPFNGTVRIAPDGRHVAATIWDPQKGAADIWIFDRNGLQSRRLTYSAEAHYRPTWSPDGQQVAFSSSRTAGPTLATIESAEGGREQRLHPGLIIPTPGDFHLPTDWSPDGSLIAYDTSLGGEQGAEIWLTQAAAPKAMPLMTGDPSQWGLVFSRDGHHVAFISKQSGRPEVYLQGFDALPSPHLVGERRQISRNGGWFVRWRPDNRELFYAGSDAKLYALPMSNTLTPGEPKALFNLPGSPRYDTPTDFQFDVEPDGRRFVMTTAASATPPPYTLIQNWQEKFRH